MLVMIWMPLASQTGQHRAHALLEQRIVAAVGILALLLLRKRDRALGEAFEDEILNVALLGQFDRGLDPIAGIAGAGADPDRLHDHASTTTYSGKTPKSTQAIVITTEAPNRNGKVNF